jgi:acetyltransferase
MPTHPDHRASSRPLGSYPSAFAQAWVSRRGEPVIIRAIDPDDEKKMVRFHQSLSELSVHWRYFNAMPLMTRVAHERLQRICQPDPQTEMVLVAVRQNPQTSDDEIVGVGRLEDLPSRRAAEFAVVISDAWQRHGIGSKLLSELIHLARAKGLAHLTAEILSDNIAMQRLCQNLGFNVAFDFEDNVMKAEMDLDDLPDQGATEPVPPQG